MHARRLVAAAIDTLGAAVAPLAAALLAAVLLLALLGYPPLDVLAGMIRGAAGDRQAISETLLRATPLLLIGIGSCAAFAAGSWNIGGEGQFVAGAIAAAAVAQAAAGVPLPIMFLAAAVAGGAIASLASILRTLRGVNEVISTLLLNFILIYFLGALVRGPMQEAARMYPQSDAMPEHLRLSRIVDGARLHSGVVAALLLYVVIAVVLSRSIFGFRLRAIGQGRQAAAFAGIAVDSYAHAAMFMSGALAGLAGSIELSGVTYRLYESFPTGAGFSGIAVALLARLRPAGVLPAALLFGAIQAACASVQRDMRISSAVAAVMQGSMILALMVIQARRVRVGAGLRT